MTARTPAGTVTPPQRAWEGTLPGPGWKTGPPLSESMAGDDGGGQAGLGVDEEAGGVVVEERRQDDAGIAGVAGQEAGGGGVDAVIGVVLPDVSAVADIDAAAASDDAAPRWDFTIMPGWI